MKSYIKILVLMVCLPLPALGQSLQCGDKLLTNGASQAEVAAGCGAPTQIEHQTIYGETGTALGPAPTPLGVLPPIGVRASHERSVEVWTYNFGPNRLMQRIRFENGVVVKIESLGYGF
jgi:uncharacterized protein DUF2845